MAECVNYNKCSYFVENLKNSPNTASMVQNSYCRGKFEQCARFIIFEKLGETRVPPDLSPSDKQRAEKILQGG
ncbi:hypothetical protein OR1_01301 [Geobacter sp. OR-1]|uniref:hypothetical protein n=1 Tax=Geobacter sp. OR-1 TaxID=1266765 RepID=UPI000542E6D2|nr:hypothetical protein [Geobacter sp. OR-1]GAM09027.1 hypothetical protein OR1_01301 [Geobacter sp. OR-1]